MIEFLLSSLVFYILMVIGIIWIIILHEKESLGWANTAFTLILVYCFWKFTDFDFKKLGDPIEIIKWVGFYLAIGIGWSFAKWYFFLGNILEDFKTSREKYEREYETDYKPSRKEIQEKNVWVWSRLKSHYSYSRDKISVIEIENNKYSVEPPNVSNNKLLITTWIMHWPISCVWTIINDPIKKLINYIFELIKSFFQSISDRMFKNLNSSNGKI